MIEYTGLYWCALLPGEDPLTTPQTEAGLFHHDFQPAFYAATSAQGAELLAHLTTAPGDPPRLLAAYQAHATRVVDLRAEPALPLDWSARATAGDRVPSWERADAARAAKATAMIWRTGAAEQIVVFAPRHLLRDTGLRYPMALANPRDERDMYR
ncbi:MAG: RES domain-containing protein [Lysobacteraceae bacterium]